MFIHDDGPNNRNTCPELGERICQQFEYLRVRKSYFAKIRTSHVQTMYVATIQADLLGSEKIGHPDVSQIEM